MKPSSPYEIRSDHIKYDLQDPKVAESVPLRCRVSLGKSLFPFALGNALKLRIRSRPHVESPIVPQIHRGDRLVGLDYHPGNQILTMSRSAHREIGAKSVRNGKLNQI